MVGPRDRLSARMLPAPPTDIERTLSG
jgi:hypothetical protein